LGDGQGIRSGRAVVRRSRVNEFLQARLREYGLEEVRAVEAAAWLDTAGLLGDSGSRPGLPLRNMLREGLIDGSQQRPSQAYGRWFITRV
jgi:hypothetical protein